MMLAASVSPSNATNNTVLWKSSNTDIATVDNGYITAVAEGNAVITAYSADNNAIEATCSVAVAAAESGGGTVKVYLVEHNVVTGKLRNKTGGEVTIGDACYVEIPYCEGMYVSTVLRSAWLGNYPPFVVYDNGNNNIAEHTENGSISSANVYQTTLTGYSSTAKVFVNITGYYKDGHLYSNNSCTISQDEYCYYTYES